MLVVAGIVVMLLGRMSLPLVRKTWRLFSRADPHFSDPCL
jgi:hypothetical protein